MMLFLKISLSADVTEYGLDLLLCATSSVSQLIAIHDMSGKGGPRIGGGGVAVSCVNTDVKYLLRMSVFTVMRYYVFCCHV